MNNSLKKLSLLAAVAGATLLPLVAAADTAVFDYTTGGSNSVSGNATGGLQLLIFRVQLIFNQIIPLMLVIGVFWFLYGVITYIMDPDDKEKGRTIMIYGIIALFVMVTVWGLVGFVGDTIGIKNSPAPTSLPLVLPQRPDSPPVSR